MIKVGLTGGIGSGKTYIANIFSELGIPVYNSDERGKYLMEHDFIVKEKLFEVFGPESFSDNKLNREYLAKQVFNNNSKLSAINKIVHPAVHEDFNHWVKINSGNQYLIKEAAILIESGAYKELDLLIVVTAPIPTRINRVIKRDNLSRVDIEKRIANQLSDQERINYADFVINNDGTMLVKTQIQEIHNKILSNSRI